jgi:uncharacterized OB-fold protein
MSQSWRPLPQITKDSEAFWASTHEHAMRMQKCSRCHKFRFYPSEACHFCASLDYTWELISGKGRIHSWTVLERARGNPFENEVPITIVLVELEEGPIVTSNLIGHDEHDLEIGAPVELEYEDVNDEVTVFVFRPIHG